MKIAVCKHGVETAFIIESSVDYDAEEYMTRVGTMHCQQCADEYVADLLGKIANITYGQSTK